MDKKEMQNWINYLNNGGDALDMFDELERKAEEKRRERESLRLMCNVFNFIIRYHFIFKL